jgi:hypothetical protein
MKVKVKKTDGKGSLQDLDITRSAFSLEKRLKPNFKSINNLFKKKKKKKKIIY